MLQKETDKLRREAKGVLNAISVTFAKFEVEVIMAKATDPECPLLVHAAELFNEGKRMKDCANKCLAGLGACEVKMPEVNVWLRESQKSARALQALFAPTDRWASRLRG